jgi:hypothetical protein
LTADGFVGAAFLHSGGGIAMLIFNDGTLFGTNENGDPVVFDWAHECGFYARIRVEAVRTYVENTWKLDWLDENAVKAKFDIEKHAVSVKSAARSLSSDFKVCELR